MRLGSEQFLRVRCWAQRVLSLLTRTFRCPQFDAARQDVTRINRHLGELLPRLEEAFVESSGHLEPLTQSSSGLINRCENLLLLASGREGGHTQLHQALHTLQGPLSYIDHCLTQQACLFELLESCESNIRSLLAVRIAINDALRPLTFTATLFKIESASLPSDLRESFLSVTSEIEHMRSLVDEVLAKNAQTLSGALSTILKVHHEMKGSFEISSQEAVKRRTHIDAAIVRLDTQLAQNSERDHKLHTESKIISDRVSDLVTGLQMQDIIQQKCSHVIAVLSDDEALGRQTVSLQAHQLEGVGHDLHEGQKKIRAGLAGLKEAVDLFDRATNDLSDLKGMTAACDGMVQLLLDTLKEASGAVETMRALSRTALDAVRPMHALAGELSSALTQLSTNMRLIALNAQIRAIQNGEGTGLEALAARTAEISTEVNRLCDTNGVALEQLRGSVDNMLAKFTELDQRGDEQTRQFAAERQKSEADLHQFRDQTLQTFTSILGSLDAIKTAVHSADHTVQPLERFVPALGSFAADLRRIATTLPPTQLSQAVANSAAEKYTMAAERQRHAVALGLTAATVAAGDGSQTPELFVDPAQAAAPASHSAPDTSMTSDTASGPESLKAGNVELF